MSVRKNSGCHDIILSKKPPKDATANSFKRPHTQEEKTVQPPKSHIRQQSIEFHSSDTFLDIHFIFSFLHPRNPLTHRHINLLHSVAYNPVPTVLILDVVSPPELIFSHIKTGHSHNLIVFP